ncbi:TonB family protein [Proteiniphilum saccharofermentans]|uniref:TonB family protein n=1 Tax=Proteiniphilum saccharofermentans TaxID=1642647 RepID=A0A1R3SU14_9BACT|nr:MULTISPECIES: energy transducer TonB [Proteiniphilum]SCD19813.1 TonB family protein [Proteiniphilum saccharofermentans]SFK92080.1 outer membrane transport energization protein TonB [Porphyromonadaceae bacterium KH3CP3RA]
MDKFINLNSQEWCDLVFEGRNKRYGAYRLRQTSSKRYAYAFFVVLVITAIVAMLPRLYGVVEDLTKKDLGPMEETVELSVLPIEEQVPEESIIKQEDAPPPPPMKSTIQFVPPVIAKDEEVTDNDFMKTQEELKSSTLQISIADVMGTDEQHGIDISDLRQTKVVVEEKIQDDKPLEFAEQAPSFPGGLEALSKFLSENIRYPVMAQENGIQGKVIVKFVVSKTGDISNIQIFRGVDTSLDSEAVRVVQAMPKWIPGKQKGKAVAVYFTLPVEFRLHS